MKTVSVNIPELVLEAIQGLIDIGMFANRGEAMRQWIKEGINNEIARREAIVKGILKEQWKEASLKEAPLKQKEEIIKEAELEAKI